MQRHTVATVLLTKSSKYFLTVFIGEFFLSLTVPFVCDIFLLDSSDWYLGPGLRIRNRSNSTLYDRLLILLQKNYMLCCINNVFVLSMYLESVLLSHNFDRQLRLPSKNLKCLWQPVLWIRIRSDPYLFGRIRIRIRILALINDPILTFLVCVKAKDTSGSLLFNFWFMKILFRAYFHQTNFQKKVGQKFIRVRIRSKIVRIRNTAGSYCSTPIPDYSYITS
jgi:hypothetical protein